MTATITQARDEMLATFKAAWDPTSLPALYPDVAGDPPNSGAWARVTIKHNEGGQATLSGDTGQRRYRHIGVVTVQIFTPTGDGQVLSDSLVTIVKGAFEGVTTSPGGVVFTRVRANEVGQDGNSYQVNVLTDFEYDEVR